MAKNPRIIDPETATAVTKYIRMSPRKARLVLDEVRKKPVHRAAQILASMNKKAARFAEKLLKSAVANAKVKGLEEDRLYIKDVRADGGPTLKRFRPRSMGRADRILKRTTHLTLVVKQGDHKYKDFPSSEPIVAEEEKGAKPKKKRETKKKTASAKA